MERHAETKVYGGKLVCLKAEVDDIVREVHISGDFFLHPEEAIGCIEDSLVGLSRETTKEEILQRITNIAATGNITMIGVNADSIADLLLEVLK